MTAHLLAQFAAVAHAHGYTIRHSRGPLGWVLWTQPRHGMSQNVACLRGHIKAWMGWKS